MDIKKELSRSFWLTKKIEGQTINLLYEPTKLCTRDYRIFSVYDVKRYNEVKGKYEILYIECLDIQILRELQEKAKSKYSDIKLEFLK